MPEYRLSPAAQSDLQQIFDYTLREWGLEQALLYDQKLESACSALADRGRWDWNAGMFVRTTVAILLVAMSSTSGELTTAWR